jgi:hypothetical protein
MRKGKMPPATHLADNSSSRKMPDHRHFTRSKLPSWK